MPLLPPSPLFRVGRRLIFGYSMSSSPRRRLTPPSFYAVFVLFCLRARVCVYNKISEKRICAPEEQWGDDKNRTAKHTRGSTVKRRRKKRQRQVVWALALHLLTSYCLFFLALRTIFKRNVCIAVRIPRFWNVPSTTDVIGRSLIDLRPLSVSVRFCLVFCVCSFCVRSEEQKQTNKQIT